MTASHWPTVASGFCRKAAERIAVVPQTVCFRLMEEKVSVVTFEYLWAFVGLGSYTLL
jgi:hypothetical protein